MAFWAFLAAALTSSATVVPPAMQPASVIAPEESPEANPLPGSQTPDAIVAGEEDYFERMTVPVTIDGEGPFRFMIDTGAQATVVTRGLTEKLNLTPKGSATVVGMGSRRTVQLVKLDGLEFAERTLNNISAPMLEKRNVGADGILGLDSLQDLRVMIDFRDETIAVNDSEALGGNEGYEIVVRARHRLGRLIITQAEIDGVKTAVIIDTGAQGSFGNMRLKRRLRARDPQAVSAVDVNGEEIIGNRHFAKRLQIQQLELQNMPITFTESPVFAALDLEKRPALILGMRDLRLFNRVAIDFATRRVLFDLPGRSRENRAIPRRPTGSRL